MSLPSRGAWIEIGRGDPGSEILNRRSLHGERGLKLLKGGKELKSATVAPFTGSVD